jgi:hypothetical protein
MNKQKWIVMVVAFALIGGAAGLLLRLQASQRLGQPAVKTSPIADSNRLNVDLPADVPGYTSEVVEPGQQELDMLPKDTSFGGRRYVAPDGFWALAKVVLMGSDRTSIHKTEFCMEGSGWRIDRSRSGEVKIHMDRPYPYDLPVMKYFTSREVDINGQKTLLSGIYVAWFVADNDEYTTDHLQRVWWLARDLLRTGVLQRWALVNYFSVCMPGQEEATFERMKKLIVQTVPDFQLVPRAPTTTASARQ